ncbi:hypothetical protein K0M31_013464, partial [Melipona bicolor]
EHRCVVGEQACATTTGKLAKCLRRSTEQCRKNNEVGVKGDFFLFWKTGQSLALARG